MNPASVKSGIRQLQRYNKALGGGFNLVLELYQGGYMDKKQFKEFCKKEFKSHGFRKQRKVFYLSGHDLLCGIDLQKSNYGEIYYVNYYYFLGDFSNITEYPTHYESDIQGRIIVMSKTQTFQGKHFETAQVEYEEYTEEELKPFFDMEFKSKILPPIEQGKKYILDNLGKLYFLTLNQEEVLRKLKM